jgi:hypothetical protein
MGRVSGLWLRALTGQAVSWLHFPIDPGTDEV